MGLALAAKVGDWKLGRKAFATLALSCVLAIVASMVIVTIVTIDPLAPELRNRTLVRPADIALACGAAGVLAFSRGGVTGTCGCDGRRRTGSAACCSGHLHGGRIACCRGQCDVPVYSQSVCLNVAGIATFLFQGLPPKSWRKTTGIMFVWGMLLGLLIAMMAGRILLGFGAWEGVFVIAVPANHDRLADRCTQLAVASGSARMHPSRVMSEVDA